MGEVSKGPEDTLQSHQASMADGHSSLRCFEASCKLLHISASKGFKGRSVSVFGFEKCYVQRDAGNIRQKGSSNGRGATCRHHMQSPVGLAPKPLPQYFYRLYFSWSQGGTAANSHGEVMLQRAGVEAGMWLWPGDTFPCISHWWSWAARMGAAGGLRRAHPQPTLGPREHSV